MKSGAAETLPDKFASENALFGATTAHTQTDTSHLQNLKQLTDRLAGLTVKGFIIEARLHLGDGQSAYVYVIV
eukprot:scaffold370405_cov40-Prasinocladus_malaysianus.AAC.3